MNKLKLWDGHKTWEEAENAWDHGAKLAACQIEIKSLKTLPNMPGITKATAKNLKWKSLWWMIRHDKDNAVFKGFIRHPFKHLWNYFKSIFKDKPFTREEDFFFYGIESTQEFEKLLAQPNTLLVTGFSYCHKPFECPSKRFTPDCIHDPENPVCRQCFIGKVMNALPSENTIPLVIPTIHYIGAQIFKVIEQFPGKQVIFLITACEMTLQMFGDWGNMSGIRGIGVRLDGRICNTMKAFELSEQGIKPGLTVVTQPTQDKILELIRRTRASL